MEIFISILTFLSLLLITLVFLKQKESSQNNIESDKDSLNEWDCQMCGFHVQMGDFCTYCYEQKP